MLVEPERTNYDLNFRLLGFPVRVHPWFWLGSALLGSRILEAGIEFFLIWIVVVFVSILVHELGHALAFRRFGSDADIVLYAFGGLAIPTAAVSGRWRRILISLAGPFAGFVFCAVVYGSNAAWEWAELANGLPANGVPLWYFFHTLWWVNLVWGLFNLLPVFPLDGGQVSRELCNKFWGTRGKQISLKISFVVAIIVVAYSLFCAFDQRGDGFMNQLPSWIPQGTVYTAILFGILAYQSYLLLQRVEWTDTHWDDRPPWAR